MRESYTIFSKKGISKLIWFLSNPKRLFMKTDILKKEGTTYLYVIICDSFCDIKWCFEKIKRLLKR